MLVSRAGFPLLYQGGRNHLVYFQASTDTQMSEYFNSILPFDLLTLELSFHVPSKQVSRRSGLVHSLPLGWVHPPRATNLSCCKSSLSCPMTLRTAAAIGKPCCLCHCPSQLWSQPFSHSVQWTSRTSFQYPPVVSWVRDVTLSLICGTKSNIWYQV